MSYDYKAHRNQLFTPSGQEMLFHIWDQVRTLCAKSGAVRFQEGTAGVTGDTWTMMACFDRLVEMGYLRELTGEDWAGQDRVFVIVRRSA